MDAHSSRGMQAVIVTDPHLISEVLAPGAEVEKSIDLVYSHFNVVSLLSPYQADSFQWLLQQCRACC